MAKRKAYVAKNLSGAQARVRMLECRLREVREILDRVWDERAKFDRDRQLMARLAADGPAFDNPAEAWSAKAYRDVILEHACGLRPDGTRIPKEK